jgi:hypothetical protein
MPDLTWSGRRTLGCSEGLTFYNSIRERWFFCKQAILEVLIILTKNGLTLLHKPRFLIDTRFRERCACAA